MEFSKTVMSKRGQSSPQKRTTVTEWVIQMVMPKKIGKEE